MNEIVAEKLQDFFDEGIPELFERDLALGEVLNPTRGNLVKVITGVRRCGKTYRLYQEMRRVIEAGFSEDALLYFNFEDERLKPYQSSLPAEVIETFFALRPNAVQTGAFLFFDEIQEVPDWGMFLRRMVDTQKVTIYISGSSSKMLSVDIATEFRGRALSRELFPMSFSEYARYCGTGVFDRKSALGGGVKASLRNLVPGYLERGGFISVQGLVPSDAVQLLQEYAYRTVNLDVIERYGLRNPALASQFLARCLATSGRELSVNKVFQAFRSAGVSVSRESLSRLLGYYEDAYLVFSLGEFSRALADNPRAASKVYAVDPGMLMAFSPSAAKDEAQRLETAVFMKLRRENGGLRKGALARVLLDEAGKRHEIDFVAGDALMQEAYQLVQVCCRMDDAHTRARETASLRAGMLAYGVEEGWIVTLDEKDEISCDEGTIHVVPAWNWLLD